MNTIRLSLISHTNVGKTTLARTLLRRDVGEVLDQAHVTDASESYVLLETGDDRLELWDTPGFGDTARLMKRLRLEKQPIGWFLHQLWDRVVDRPLWCSQEAARNVKEQAEVVLYLVNAAEDPEDAGYVPLELELLTWVARPVMLLLNQTGGEGADLERRWRQFVTRWPVVRDVLSLDAFTRCWVEEGVLLQRVIPLLDAARRETMSRLAAAWNERNLQVFRDSCTRMSRYLAEAACDREAAEAPAGGDGAGKSVLRSALKFAVVDKKRAMEKLDARLDRATRGLMDGLIALHGLHGSSAARIERRMRDFQVKGAGLPLDERSGALAGAVISGALTGLAADAMTGGLSLGGGMIAGGILGALGGAAVGRGYRLLGGKEQPSVSWSPHFLDQLARQTLLRYLSVAHFGRGRGQYRDIERPAHWSGAVDQVLARDATRLSALWSDPVLVDHVAAELQPLLDDAMRGVLRRAYPAAGALLER